jgi:methylated-DNA-protein-cysteine methyltransferase-like protein
MRRLSRCTVSRHAERERSEWKLAGAKATKGKPAPSVQLRAADEKERTVSWQRVYRWIKRIPRGRVVTYGQLARALRLRGGARTAGRALAACPAGRGIPWQRVVGAGGRILIREPQASLQKKMLEAEGVRFVSGRVEMTRHAWQPGRCRRKPA